MSSKRPSLTPVTDTETPTAASIAAAHFQKEVDLHQSVDLQSKTLVVVHDACYGHRFSRPRTTRAGLSTIVERPERIRAGLVGLSAAYVRLGRRRAGERFAPHPDLDVHLLPPPPFQIRKTGRSMGLNSPAVTHVHGTKWMDDLRGMCDAAESRLAFNGKELVRPASRGDTAPALHEGDLYLCSESLNAFEGAIGGVCEGIDAVFGTGSTKRAFVCIRPPGHHCSAGHPSGFCWLNNVHVGISYAAMTHGLTHAAILDFDLHHGDGSQEITWEQNRKAAAASKNAPNYKKTSIGYFSVHDINSYPCEMGDPEKVRNASVCIDKAHGQSIWNVHLEPWKTSAEFWELYATRYALLIEKARAFLRHHTERLASNPNGPPPKAAIFISAGFDASEWEGAGMQRHKANVPTDFYAKFTADVVRMAGEGGLGVDERVISVLEGGYSDRALTSGILSHLAGLGDATADDQINRLTSEMTDRLGLSTPDPTIADFDSEWWSPNCLEELEALVSPPVKREKSGPTYSAPTQSFTAKVAGKDRKSTGSLPETPLPEVGWATAAHELSKILIPSHRQTMSCRPEELNAEASRVRQRQAMDADVEEKRKLRVRKSKSSLPSTPVETPRATRSRRTTLDAANLAKIQGEKGTPDGVDTSPTAGRSTSRPGTAASNRSASARKPRATPKRSASPKKAPPVPKVPATVASDSRQPDEMDSLVAGVRKIKLKVPSPEEHAAREKAKATPKSPKKAKPRPQLNRSSSAPSSKGPAKEPSLPPELPTELPNAENTEPWSGDSVVPAQVPSETVISPPITPGSAPTATESTGLYSPSKFAQDKHGLPVFTSTSTIPFADGGVGHFGTSGEYFESQE